MLKKYLILINASITFFQVKGCVSEPMKYIKMLGNPVNNHINTASLVVWKETDRPYQPPSEDFEPRIE